MYYSMLLSYKPSPYVPSLCPAHQSLLPPVYAFVGGGAGGSMSPDLNGFVEIPEGATGFTVKYNGIPTGAMVIFFNP